MKWKWLRRREEQPQFQYVYVNQDGSVREVSPDERAYLSAELVKQFQIDPLGLNRAARDIIVRNADGSVTCRPNPEIPHRERFERSRNYRLAEQRRLEDLAKR